MENEIKAAETHGSPDGEVDRTSRSSKAVNWTSWCVTKRIKYSGNTRLGR